MKQKIIITFVAIFVSFRIMADNTILVGTIDVNATVSESGGAVVTIPIDVPAGINGMQPNLALVYNSQGGLGTCGWGWSLSGLSSISRTGSTPYYDNTVRGVMLDSLDNLRLDSQRLFLESGQNLAAGAVYRTEVESWSKITFKTASTGFEVKTKDGVTAIYGDSYLSRLAYTPTSGVNALAWNISKVTDACGNYMTYTYTTSYYPGESYITKIAYTGNTLTVSPTKEGGFGMVKGLGAKTDIGKLTAKLGYQMIGTTMGSIGDNWVKGNNLFSKVVVGVGPINFTIGKGQKLLQWQNNKGNILVNTIGLGNCLFGGKVDFDWRNLSINYSGGVVDAFVPDSYSSGFGAHAIIGNKNLYGVIGHELHHLWQSRAYGDNYVLNYGLQGIDAFLNTGLLSSIISNDNYFERQAYGAYWW